LSDIPAKMDGVRLQSMEMISHCTITAAELTFHWTRKRAVALMLLVVHSAVEIQVLEMLQETRAKLTNQACMVGYKDGNHHFEQGCTTFRTYACLQHIDGRRSRHDPLANDG